MILEVSVDSSWWVRAAAAAIVYLHIAGGTLGIIAGAAALSVTKGGRTHRIVGDVFFISMTIMATIGAVVSPFLPKPQWANVFMGALTCYLMATSWMTIRRQEGRVGRFEYGAFIIASSIALAALVGGAQAMNMPNGMIDGLPYQVAYGFAATWTLVAAADLKMILRGGVFGAQRILRHLWRMCVALLIAVVSLFLGQAKVFPEWIRGTGLLFLPVLAVSGAMIFWMLRVRFAKRWRQAPTRSPLQSAPSPPTTAC